MITCKKSDNRIDYAAPLLSNGELSVTIDYTGVQTKESVPIRDNLDRMIYPLPEILMAGRRLRGHEWEGILVPHGVLSQADVGEVVDWEQSLSLDTASTIIKTVFDDGLEITTEAFVSLSSNILAVRKTFSKAHRYTLTYGLENPKFPDKVPHKFTSEITSGGEIQIDYTVDGRILFEGKTRLVCKGNMHPEISGNRFSFVGDVKADEPVDWFFIFSDNVRPNNVPCVDWDSLYKENVEIINEYNSEGYAVIGDERIDNAYKTASYHLRCVTTPWGIPTGIFRTHWNSVYFPFDEFYMIDALLSSNHKKGAKHSVDYRANTLDYAVRRSSLMSRFPEKMQARYPWHTDEEGKDVSSPGYWNDHIFHMANIAMGAWEYYLHSGDTEYLREKLYPVIKACAGFYHFNMVYRLKDKTVIGHCTDLERLGPSIMNAYMTTCSAIKLFRIFSEAADLLGADEELSKACKTESEELFDGLPKDSEKYLAYPDFTGASVGVITGTYPYHIHEEYSELEHKAVVDYIERELSFGNMYEMGKRICSWYALWKAIYFIRRGDTAIAYDSVLQSIGECGAFYEMFEINEEAVSYRPWFATASAYVITAVNEMLLQKKGERIRILPCIPEHIKDVSFKLSTHGAVTVTFEMKDRKVNKLNIDGSNDEYIIELPKDVVYNGKEIKRENRFIRYEIRK